MFDQLHLPVELAKRRRRLNQNQLSLEWPLSILFGKPLIPEWLSPVNMYDFEMEHYIYFLDHVETKEQLVRGLEELSPFADDSLAVAEWMSKEEFALFRKLVPVHHEAVKQGLDPAEGMSGRITIILLPEQFMNAIWLSEKGGASLGVALVRSWEVIYSKKGKRRQKKVS